MAKVPWKSPSIPWHACTPEQRRLLNQVYRDGDLSWKLPPSQLRAYKAVKSWRKARLALDKPEAGWRKFALDMGRRIGKSACLCVLAMEDCFQNKGWRVPYVAPTMDDVKDITLPLIQMLLIDCPPDLHPKWKRADAVWEFYTGSYMEMIGLDVRPAGGRGRAADRVYGDEIGFFINAEEVVEESLFPQMLGRPWADMVAGSTPPKSTSHYWSEEYVPSCIRNDAHIHMTLREADQYSDAEIQSFYDQMPGGQNGVKARREYDAEHISDENLTILPEFREAQEHIVREWDAPSWRDCYVAMDPGYHDLTAILFGYWDFYEHKLIIEDEESAPRLNSGEIARVIKRKEAVLWEGQLRKPRNGSDTYLKQPFMRICPDDNPRLIADLSKDHQLLFQASKRDNLISQVDAVRVAIQRHEIIIHPRCTKLVKHCKQGIWKENRVGKDFAREGDKRGTDTLGHFDLIAALVYLWRNVHKSRCPEPAAQKYVAGDLKVKQAPQYASGSKWIRNGHRFFIVTGKVK